MSEKIIKLTDKVDLSSRVNTLRKASLTHSKAAKEIGCTSGVFISLAPNGSIQHDSWGCDGHEKVALLEIAKQLTIKEIYG